MPIRSCSTLCRVGREGAAPDRGTDESGFAGQEGGRRETRKSNDAKRWPGPPGSDSSAQELEGISRLCQLYLYAQPIAVHCHERIVASIG